MEETKEQLKVVSFLSGLDVQYTSAKNQLLSGTELPSLNVAFSRLSRIPVEDIAEPIIDNEKSAVAATTRPSSSSSTGRGRG